MSQVFELNPIRNVDRNGVLQGVGIEWTEECSLRHTNRMMMWLAFLMCVPFTAFSFMGLPYFPAQGLIGLVLFGGAAVYVLVWQLGPLPRRSVVFERNGRITTPHGLPGGGNIRTQQPEIVSIEIGPCRSGLQSDWTSTVKLVTDFGRTITVGQKLHQEEAREVAVGLSRALTQIRSSVGGPTIPSPGQDYGSAFVD